MEIDEAILADRVEWVLLRILNYWFEEIVLIVGFPDILANLGIRGGHGEGICLRDLGVWIA